MSKTIYMRFLVFPTQNPKSFFCIHLLYIMLLSSTSSLVSFISFVKFQMIN